MSESDNYTHTHGPIDDAAVTRAEQALLAAREAWHRERGDTPPPDEEPPDSVQKSHRAFLSAREQWHHDRETKARHERGIT